jgi:hypothetical protein
LTRHLSHIDIPFDLDCLAAKPCGDMRRAQPESGAKIKENMPVPGASMDTEQSVIPVAGNLHSRRRINLLASKGWRFERGSSVLLKVSPGRKLRFRSMQAAEEFEKIRQENGLDEYKASGIFLKRMKKQGLEMSKLVVGGIGTFSTSRPCTHNSHQHRHDALREQKWAIERDDHNGYATTLKVSPDRKLKFRSMQAAEEFERIRQENGLDEYKASGIFLKRMKDQGREIAQLVVGGINALSMLPCTHNSHQHRHDALCEQKWTIKRDERNGYTKTLKISPSGMLQFISSQAAEDFEGLRQECNGDECKAFDLFLKKYRGHKISELVKGGKSALSSSSVSCDDGQAVPVGDVSPGNDPLGASMDTEESVIPDARDLHSQRRSILASKGWGFKRGNYHQLLKVSPGRGLEFITTQAAEEFQMIRQENGLDEYKASDIFLKQMKKQGREVAKLVVGGINSLSTRSCEANIVDANSRQLNSRQRRLLSKGWTARYEEVSNKTRWITPGLGIKFRFIKAAETFEALRQKCKGDERKAAKMYALALEQQNQKVSNFAVGLMKWENEPNSSSESSKSQRRPKSKAPTSQSQPSLETKVNSDTIILEEHKSRASSCLKDLSQGWKPISYQYEYKNELHFQSPVCGFEFKSFKGARLFDEMLKDNSDESTAFDAFIQEYGRDKVRGMVGSLRSRHGVIPSEKPVQQTQVNKDLTTDLENNDDLGDGYWEIEQVLRVRFIHGRMQCLVRWRASCTDTWEPSDNLCDTASESFFSYMQFLYSFLT